jgi:hypothetical protein
MEMLRECTIELQESERGVVVALLGSCEAAAGWVGVAADEVVIREKPSQAVVVGVGSTACLICCSRLVFPSGFESAAGTDITDINTADVSNSPSKAALLSKHAT